MPTANTDNTLELSDQPVWWGQVDLTEAQGLKLRIGPLDLAVRRLAEEWQIGYQRDMNLSQEEVDPWQLSEADFELSDYSHLSRYIYRRTSGPLVIQPALADRPVIARPITPFNLSPGEEAILFVSSPVWVQVAAGKSSNVLEEIPIHRSSDTWFGPSTQEGELCYASRTHARLHLEEVPMRPHRAITPVLIQNRASTLLTLERLSVPAPLLPLYETTTGFLWTSMVTLVREEDGDMASLRISKSPPEQAIDARQLGKPRQRAEKGLMVRAFNALFS